MLFLLIIACALQEAADSSQLEL
uniref:Uncharacterized protein n=1 Tax=Arundo donax TaxID=35708 RepID=A0A0A9F148_ARUDO